MSKRRPPAPRKSLRSYSPAIVAVYGVSGFCALAVETLWIRALSVRVGNTVETATLVIATFFLFAALGNWWGGRIVARTARPLAWYGACEILGALAAAICYLCRAPVYTALSPLVAANLIVLRCIYVAVLVGPASIFAGMAFPAVSEVLITSPNRRAQEGGSFYSANLIGAALGVIGGGLILPWQFGNTISISMAIILQFVIGAVAWLISRRWTAGPRAEAAQTLDDPLPLPPFFGWAVLIGSGLLSLLTEILVLSYFQQFTPASLYAMAAVLFAFIINLGIGSLLVACLRAKSWRNERLLLASLAITGAMLIIYPLVLQRPLQSGLLPPQDSLVQWTIRAVMAAVLMFAPLLIPLGMVFPLGWEIVERGSRHQGQAMGHAMSVNKAACAFGAVLGPFILVPLVGLPGAMLASGCAYLVLAVWASSYLQVRKPIIAVVAAAALVLAVAAFTRAPVPVGLNPGDRLLRVYQGPDGVVAVTEDARGSRHIVLNQTYTLNGTDRALRTQRQESWIPLLLCPNPKSVAFIGMASGISAASALDFPINQLTAIELEPSVARAARENFGKWNSKLFYDRRARVVVNDGRFVIQSSHEKYDLIITDLLNPALEGATSLYSRDFLLAERSSLSRGGLCCVWLPMYQLDEELAGTVFRTFTDVFPRAILVRGNFDPFQPVVGLIGLEEPIDISTQFLSSRLQQSPRAARAESPFFRSPAHARLMLMGDLGAVSSDFEQFAPNSDDNQRFAFLGPKLLPHGTVLRGNTLLTYLGNRFEGRGFPSCSLGSTTEQELYGGMMAGNYYFAASVSIADIPADALTRLRRAATAEADIKHAAELAPAATLEWQDLGR